MIGGGEEAPTAVGSSQPLEWKFAQVFGERTAGEEVQEVSFNNNERRRFRGDRSYMRDDGWGSGVVASSKALRAQDSSEETMEDMNGDSFQKVKQRFKDRTMKVAQTKEMLSKQAVQTKEILSKQAVTHLLRVLGFGGFCFLLGASEWNWFDS
ncbi:glycerophosphocholine acyltransferase 1 [Fagus crenata]